MKSYKILMFAAFAFLFFLGSCKKINNAMDANQAILYTVSVKSPSLVPGIRSTEGLKITFENFNEGFRLEHKLTNGTNTIEGLIPGIYSINISGRADNDQGETYFLNGSKINYAITKNGEMIEIPVNGLKQSPLIFSEIFYCGTDPFYFRNQYYEIYNNSEHSMYLDGIYFASLTPTKTTTVLPLWPAADGDNYVYAERIWKFPGSGKQYPIAPGESIVISQFAANHKLPQYNPASPIDGSSSEFEFNMDNANFPDQPAVDMVHVYYNNSASKGTSPQYLTSVFGGAYVIFKVPEGETYDPVNDERLKTKNMASAAAQVFAKVPVRYVLDGVEAGDNENAINAKRMSSVLDAGMTYVGANYISRGVTRKVLARNADGSPILMDTNNSTDDFERGVVPMFRRFGSKMPIWNHSRK